MVCSTYATHNWLLEPHRISLYSFYDLYKAEKITTEEAFVYEFKKRRGEINAQ